MAELTCPRAALFVPADKPALLARAATRGADAVILDLEDAVAPANRPAARAALPGAIAALADRVPIWVRVNPDLRDLAADLHAALRPGVAAILLPKARSADVLRYVLAALGGVPLVALVEQPAALPRLDALARSGVAALAFGPEDFSAAAGTAPDPVALRVPAQMVALAAAAAGIPAYGYPGSIGNFRDLDRLAADMALGRALGFQGAMVIHPDQIAVAQSAYAVTQAEAEWARAVIAGFDPATGVGALDGRMIDAPVHARARALLARLR